MTNIFVIIPVRNRISTTRKMLEKLNDQLKAYDRDCGNLNFQIIVIDDGSTDGTSQMVGDCFPTFRLIQGCGSLWWTGAIKVGMKYANADFCKDFFLWLNDDLEILEGFVRKISHVVLENQSERKVIGGIVLSKKPQNWIMFGGVKSGKPIRSLDWFKDEDIASVDTINGNLALFPAMLVKEIAWPDDQRFRHYGGDYEYFSRAKRAGFQINLSCEITAVSDFSKLDIIRYMPAWMQYRLADNPSEKLSVILGLMSLKSNYNIWHMVNLMNKHREHVFFWEYYIFAIKKLIQIFIFSVQSSDIVREKVETYMNEQEVPPEIKKSILKMI
jgi:glycosyltransferase involved in cell wall biosynthesis